MRNTVLQQMAAGGKHLAEISDALTSFEHGHKLGRQKLRNLFKRPAQIQPLLHVRRKQMETNSQRTFTARRDTLNGRFWSTAILQTHFEQFEEQSGPLAATHRKC